MPRQPQSGVRPARDQSPISFPRIDTNRFYLRLLTPDDASERWIAWLGDIEVMEPLNTRLRRPTIEQLRKHIAGYDQRDRLLIGIFDKANDLHIGIYQLDLDRRHGLATFSVLIGDKAYWGQRTVLETRAALLDRLFRRMEIEKALGLPMARNFPAVFNYRAQGWVLEGIFKDHRISAQRKGRLDQLQFGLTKAAWVARRKALQ